VDMNRLFSLKINRLLHPNKIKMNIFLMDKIGIKIKLIMNNKIMMLLKFKDRPNNLLLGIMLLGKTINRLINNQNSQENKRNMKFLSII